MNHLRPVHLKLSCSRTSDFFCMTDRLHGFVVDDIDCVDYVSKIQKFSSRRRRGLLFPSMLKDKLDVPPHVGDLAGHGRGSIAKYLSILFAP